MISYRFLDLWTDADFAAHARWENNEEIRHLFVPCFSPDKKLDTTADQIKANFLAPVPDGGWHFFHWMIDLDHQPVGHMCFCLDPGIVFSPRPGVAWLSMALGEKEAWGTGVAQEAFGYLMKEAKKRGGLVAELGVFSFNQRARRFYQKLGFEEFASAPSFTYWDGQWWPDIRMRRML